MPSSMNLIVSSVFAVLFGVACLSAHAEPVPGGIYVYTLPPGATQVTYRDAATLLHEGRAIVGIPISIKAGEERLRVRFEDGSELVHRFQVSAKAYPEQRITLKNQKMVTPDPEHLKRIRSESQRMRSAYRTHRERDMNALTPFVQPLEGIMTSPFGRRRILNGEPRSPHSGIDIARPTGTPITAPAPGTVTVVGDFYFNGITALVDHGQGLVTMYCHMSEAKVAEGDVIGRGETIGLVGSTGRSTGPHLHWSVSLNGYRVDPVAVMAALAGEATAATGAAAESTPTAAQSSTSDVSEPSVIP